MITQGEVRRILGHFATGVTVITTRDADGQPRGLTANAFTSLSLDPPLVLICVSQASQTHDALHLDEAVFAVNILTQQQEAVARVFASKHPDKFHGIAYSAGVTGAPILEGVLAFLECGVVDRLVSGDHTIIVGEVRHLGSGLAADPLVFYHGRYTSLTEDASRRAAHGADGLAEQTPRLLYPTAS